MHKDTLKETLKAKSMSLRLTEVEEIMETELNKAPEEMDTELIDLCAETLEKTYLKNDKHEHKNSIKSAGIKRIALIAAVIAVFFSVVIPINAKLIQMEVSSKIVHFYDDFFNIDLSNAKSNAITYSDPDSKLVKILKKHGAEKVILPAELLSDDYKYKVKYHNDDHIYDTIMVDFENKANSISGHIVLHIQKKSAIDLVKSINRGVSRHLNCVKQIYVNGMDIIVFGNSKSSCIIYADQDTDYTIMLDSCNFETAIKIAESTK